MTEYYLKKKNSKKDYLFRFFSIFRSSIFWMAIGALATSVMAIFTYRVILQNYRSYYELNRAFVHSEVEFVSGYDLNIKFYNTGNTSALNLVYYFSKEIDGKEEEFKDVSGNIIQKEVGFLNPGQVVTKSQDFVSNYNYSIFDSFKKGDSNTFILDVEYETISGECIHYRQPFANFDYLGEFDKGSRYGYDTLGVYYISCE